MKNKIFLVLMLAAALLALPSSAEQVSSSGATVNYIVGAGGNPSGIVGQSVIGNGIGVVYAWQSASTPPGQQPQTGNMILISPADTNQADKNSVEFSWQQNSQFKSYDLSITNLETNQTETINSPVDKIQKTLNDGTYRWSVTGKKADGTETKSAILTLYVNSSGPQVEVKVSGKTIIDGMIIDPNGTLTVSVVDPNGVDSSSLNIQLNGKTAQFTAQGVSAKTSATSKLALPPGTNSLNVVAADSLGKTTSITYSGLKTFAGAPSIDGRPMNYPNPFKPASGQSITLNYKLSANADIKIMIFDITGRLVWQKAYSSGTNGGQLDENEIVWNGKSFSGETMGNGVYLYMITADGKKIGQGEIAIND